MNIMRLLLLGGLMFANYGTANAMTTADYGMLQESISLALAFLCLVFAVLILGGHRGGALGRPWAFFVAAFILVGTASLLRLFDLNSILFSEYDLRPAFLVTRTAALLFMLVGLIFYKKELQ
jgi:hypothetical protein